MPIPDGHALEGFIVVGRGERQTLWSMLDVGRNLFQSKKEDRIRENMTDKSKVRHVTDFHHSLFPGVAVPNEPCSKHAKSTAAGDDANAGGGFYLERRCIATSMLVAWVAYGIAYANRMPADRKRARQLLRGLLMKLLVTVSRIRLLLPTSGFENHWCEAFVSIDGKVAARDCYSPAVLAAIRIQWEHYRLQGLLDSHLENPLLLDVICFALYPDNAQGNLLKPLSFSLLAQFTKVFDEHPISMSEHTSKYRDMLLKNRARATVALRAAVRSVGVFLMHQNVTRIGASSILRFNIYSGHCQLLQMFTGYFDGQTAVISTSDLVKEVISLGRFLSFLMPAHDSIRPRRTMG